MIINGVNLNDENEVRDILLPFLNVNDLPEQRVCKGMDRVALCKETVEKHKDVIKTQADIPMPFHALYKSITSCH